MNISILGSTGSIGSQTLDIVDMHPESFKVCAITASTNVTMAERQARKYKPALAVMYNEDAADDLRVRLADTNTQVLSGMDGLIAAASMEQADTVVTAVVGMVGLRPTLAAIDSKKRIALANKETLVCAGELVMEGAKKHGAQIVPVDSEHSAIFQCIDHHDGNGVKRILLTASGGPFRGMTRAQMASVTPEMALKNPNWSMGPKVTVDSATMMNKGLEFIEAMHLFSVMPEQITVLVHPQSIVHSAVEFEDNSVIAQLGVPDMRIPIQYALTYPGRKPSPAAELDLTQIGRLEFETPRLEDFPCLRLAMEMAGEGGTAC
ncbi:MAG: 1-deoxy-D-xylulose-5-phosphate reductoisomerase, partial [Oscillospiraceae bacterium]|nr:1-deoxy-D-xylulose-5-phosphate reductoisomerase [Oscillospiraceae bacterium]